MKISSLLRTNPVILLEQCLCYSWCDPSSSPSCVSCQMFSDPAKKVVLCLLALCMPRPLDLKHSHGFLPLHHSALHVHSWSVGWCPRPHTAMSLNTAIWTYLVWAHTQKYVPHLSVFILEYYTAFNEIMK